MSFLQNIFGPPNVDKLRQKGDIQGLIKVMVSAQNGPAYRAAADVLEHLGWQPPSDEKGAAFWAAKERWDLCIQTGRHAATPLMNVLAECDKGRGGAIAAALQGLSADAAKPLVSAFIAGLGEKNQTLQKGATQALLAIGPVAIDPLVAALGDKNKKVHAGAAATLFVIGQPSASALIKALGDTDDEVQASAVVVLMTMGPGVEGLLLNALRSNDRRIRGGTATVLGKMKSVQSVDPIIQSFRGGSMGNWVRPALALAEIGSPAVTPLIEALKSEDEDLRGGATMALGRMGDPAVQPLLALVAGDDHRIRIDALMIFRLMGASAAPSLMKAYRSGNLIQSSAAGQALESIGVAVQ